MMANKARGEATIQAGEATLTLALGLGALAELESTFEVDNFEEAMNFERFSASRFVKFVSALVVGNGLKLDDEMKATINKILPGDFMAFVAELMIVTGLSAKSEETAKGDGDAPLLDQPGGPLG